MVGAILASCDSGKKGNGSPTEVEEEDPTALPYGATDTIEGQAVSPDCAKLNFDIERLQNRIDCVQSPNMLMRVKADFEHIRDSLCSCTSGLPSNEKELITAAVAHLNTTFKAACHEYEIPADGVISNLKNCIEQISRAQNSTQFYQVTDCRRGMLRSLDIIHLCVESNSSQIPEVKRLAAQLKNVYEQQLQRYSK